MKQYLKFLPFLFIFALIMDNVEAQTKTKIKTKSETPKFVEQSFGTPSSVTDITDIPDSSLAYPSLSNLIGQNITLTYDDNTFRGNEPIRRGDFIVALNSSLEAIKKVEAENGLEVQANDNSVDTDSASTQDAAQSKETPSNDMTAVKESSVYYPAVQSLMQKGVALPFEKSKSFNPGAPMGEKEVYNILNEAFGYSKNGMNPYATSMTRSKFAVVLNNAVSNKLQQDYSIIDQKNAEAEQARQAEQQRLQAEMQQQEQTKRDSLNSAYKADQMEIERKALENQSKKKRKSK